MAVLGPGYFFFLDGRISLLHVYQAPVYGFFELLSLKYGG